MRIGFTVDQLVHDYGDVCQAITELAVDLDKTISADDFRTLNKCLDFAIAQAVTEFERQRARQQSEQENERTGFLAHELNNLVTTAKLTFHVLKQGKVGIGGSTGAVLERTLNSIADMVDRSVAKVRAATGVYARERVWVSELMEELRVVATIEAATHGFKLEVSQLDDALQIETDRLLVVGAVVNLLRNASKFSPPAARSACGCPRSRARKCASRLRTNAAAFRRAMRRGCSSPSNNGAATDQGWASAWPSAGRISAPSEESSAYGTCPGKAVYFRWSCRTGRGRSRVPREHDFTVRCALEKIACTNLVRTEPTPGAPIARPGGVESYRGHVQDATTKQHSKSGSPSKLPAADQEAAFAGGRHPFQPILFIAKGQSRVRCRPPSTPELPLELGRDRQSMRADLRAPIACLNIKSDVGQRTNDDVEGEWTDEVAWVKSQSHDTVSLRRLHDCGLHLGGRVRSGR